MAFERGTKIMYDLLDESLRTGKPVTVNIYDLLGHLDGSCDVGDDDGWIMDMFTDKIGDVSTMVWLLPSILHNGLQCPLNVVHSFGYGRFIMGNGHHRLVLALLCGIEEIEVIVSDGGCDFRNSEIPGLYEESVDLYRDADARIFYEILDDINYSRVPDDDDDDDDDDDESLTYQPCKCTFCRAE